MRYVIMKKSAMDGILVENPETSEFYQNRPSPEAQTG